MFKACIGLNCARHVDFLDRRHGSLTHIPDEVYRNEEHLEELLLDMNGLQDLPPVSDSSLVNRWSGSISQGKGAGGRDMDLGRAYDLSIAKEWYPLSVRVYENYVHMIMCALTSMSTFVLPTVGWN